MMTVNNEVKKTEIEPKAEKVKNKKVQKSTAKPKPVNKVAASLWIVFSFATFIGLCVLGYIGYSQIQATSDRILNLESAQRRADEQNRSIAKQLSQSLNNARLLMDEKIAEADTLTQNKITNLTKQLAATDHKVLLFAGRHRTDWLLAEAAYLTRIANNRLIHQRDPETALALLVSAQERIVLMDDPNLLAIREALSKDMAALRLAKHDDVAAIAIRITGLLAQISNLSLQRFDLPKDVEEVEINSDLSEKTWQQGLQETFKELSVKWFDLKKHEQEVQPMMSEAAELMIKNNMALMLQTAQFATLRQKQELYINSIDQLLTWLNDYYDHEDVKVINFKQELQTLKTMTVLSNLPKVLQSSVLISREVQSRLAIDEPETDKNASEEVQ